MGIRIPAYLLDTARQLGLQSWVKSSQFPRQEYFTRIDAFQDQISSSIFATEDGVSNDELIAMVCILIDREGALLTHVQKKAKRPINSDDDWDRFVLSAAWAILQRYVHEVEAGEWP